MAIHLPLTSEFIEACKQVGPGCVSDEAWRQILDLAAARRREIEQRWGTTDEARK